MLFLARCLFSEKIGGACRQLSYEYEANKSSEMANGALIEVPNAYDDNPQKEDPEKGVISTAEVRSTVECEVSASAGWRGFAN